MGSVTRDTFKLPKIDLSSPDLYPGNPTWDHVRSDVVRALKEFGCFEAVHETLISPELHGSLLMKDGLIEELFGLPVEVKRRFEDPTMPVFGYRGGNSKLEPIVEAVGQQTRTHRERVAINEVLDSPAIRNMTHLLWPEGNSRFCESLLNYAKKISTLDLLVKRMVFEELDMEKYFDCHGESSFYSMRINKYALPNKKDEQLETRPHQDKGFLTILQQNEVNGLMIQTKEGEWFNVSFSSPSSFIVLVGESFLAWSNGRLQCPSHHVVMCSGGETRLSIAMASSVKGAVKCPEELVDEDHPLLFRPFEETEIYKFLLTEEGRKQESTTKAYFGV